MNSLRQSGKCSPLLAYCLLVGDKGISQNQRSRSYHKHLPEVTKMALKALGIFRKITKKIETLFLSYIITATSRVKEFSIAKIQK